MDMPWSVYVRQHASEGESWLLIARTLYRSSAIQVAGAYQVERPDMEVRVRGSRSAGDDK